MKTRMDPLWASGRGANRIFANGLTSLVRFLRDVAGAPAEGPR
jgi:hypothetical protein